MQARDLMTENPCCCTIDSSVREVARMMVEHDCGEIPVTDSMGVPVGVMTDRDICVRLVAQGVDSSAARVGDYMTTPAITARRMDSADDCRILMEQHMIRRLPVVDESGRCIGIISQADLATKADSYTISHLVKEVSVPTPSPNNFGL